LRDLHSTVASALALDAVAHTAMPNAAAAKYLYILVSLSGQVSR
jgi:hypothetical protein